MTIDGTLERRAAERPSRLTPAARRAAGVYYTPEAVVQVALDGLPTRGAVCDFACGSGHFLVAEARRRLAVEPPARVASELFGRDLDAEAVHLGRERLVALLGEAHRATITAQVAVADGLAPFPRAFDVVVANPPYRGGRLAGVPPAQRAEVPTASYQPDLYTLFLDRALRLLVPGGRAVVVCPSTWLATRHGGPLRAFVLGHHGLQRLVRLPADAFPAGVEAALACFEAGAATAAEIPVLDLAGARRGTLLFDAGDPGAAVIEVADAAEAAFVRRARRCAPLSSVAEITRGVNPYHHTTHTRAEIAARIHHATTPQGPGWQPELRGRHLPAPLQLAWGGDTFIHYGPHLKEPREPRFFAGPRLVVRKILGRERLHAAWIDAPFICDQSIYVVYPRPEQPWDLATLLGCLTSRRLASLVRARTGAHEHLFPQLKVADLKEFPLPDADPAGPRARAVAACARGGTDLAALEAEVVALYGA